VPPVPPDGQDAQPWPAYWRSLRYFALTRLAVAAVLIAYVPLMRGSIAFQDGFDARRFLAVAVCYLAAAVLFALVSRPGRFALQTLAIAQVSIDLVALALLLHASGGLLGGLAVLLILPNAGAAILLGARMAVFFAAVSAIGLLADTAWRWLKDPGGDVAFVQSGLVGAALLATVLIVNRLAARLEAQERLAWRRGEDVRRQLAVTQAVIGALQDGVVVLGEDGALRAINRSARAMLGGASEEQAGAQLPGLLSLQAALSVRPLSQAGVTGAEEAATEAVEVTVFAGPDGAERRIRARRLGATPTGADAVIVLEDLGRLEQRAQQLKLASMGRLSASISHEIRNPLAAIRHANGLLAERLNDGGLRRLATIVEDNCLRINRIVEDVLSITRRGGATPEPLVAESFLPATIGEYFAQAGADLRRIDCRIDSAAPIWFDAGNLRQVLLNLLTNALRHASGAPGAVRIEWHEDATGRPVLTISDDGPGVSAAARAHLFEPFFTTEARGTGLGLHLTRELCNANGAAIRYRPAGDNPPVRSAFIVEPQRLPALTDR
jgi:two-component system sensor histidine kinase PilS (NtrC family)